MMDADDVIKAFCKNEIGLVLAADRLREVFLNMGLLYVEQIPPMKVLWDLVNRGGSLGSCEEIPSLMENIGTVGFAWTECDHAYAAELPPGDLKDRTIAANRDFVGGKDRCAVRI